MANDVQKIFRGILDTYVAFGLSINDTRGP